MANKTPNNTTAAVSTAAGSANGVSRASAAKSPSRKKTAATGSTSAKQRVVTSEQIGKTAGEIWQVLADQDAQTLAGLKKSVDAPGDLVLAAVGWLAREDKLQFTARGRSVKVSLRL